MFRNLAATALALALMAPAAFANGVLTLESDQQAVVYLDGEEVGTTPMTLSDIDPGYHVIRYENQRTGQVAEYNFYSPRKATVHKSYSVAFASMPMPVPQPVAVQPGQPAPVVVQGPPPPHDNTKVRMRNTLLGAGLVNEVFNNGSSKGGIRKGVVGAGLLNELINR